MRKFGVSLDCEAVWVEYEVEWGLSDLVESNNQELVNGEDCWCNLILNVLFLYILIKALQ